VVKSFVFSITSRPCREGLLLTDPRSIPTRLIERSPHLPILTQQPSRLGPISRHLYSSLLARDSPLSLFGDDLRRKEIEGSRHRDGFRRRSIPLTPDDRSPARGVAGAFRGKRSREY